MADRWTLALAALAALAGAAGVIAAAAGAHETADPLMTTAANFLLLHAAAILAVCALARSLPARTSGVIGAASFILGSVSLFSGDLATRALTGARLFPFAAPIGGTGLIVGWLALAVALAVAAFKKPGSITR